MTRPSRTKIQDPDGGANDANQPPPGPSNNPPPRVNLGDVLEEVKDDGSDDENDDEEEKQEDGGAPKPGEPEPEATATPQAVAPAPAPFVADGAKGFELETAALMLCARAVDAKYRRGGTYV